VELFKPESRVDVLALVCVEVDVHGADNGVRQES